MANNYPISDCGLDDLVNDAYDADGHRQSTAGSSTKKKS